MKSARRGLVAGFMVLGWLAAAGWAAASPAALASVAASATPSVQGVGGSVTVSGTADIWGACCGVTESTGMVATLTLPPGLELVSGENPRALPDVTIPPGKGAAPSASWTVRATVPGEFNFTVRISSHASGTAEGTAAIRFVQGPVISEGSVFPLRPVPDRPVTVSAAITSPVGIREAVLSYSTGAGWTPVNMQPQSGDTWSAILPRFPEGTVDYRISATDNEGVTLESSAASFKVADQARIQGGVDLITYAGSALALLTTVVVLAGFWMVRVRWGRPRPDAPGLHVIGSGKVVDEEGGRTGPVAPAGLGRLSRYAVLAALIIVSLALVAWGLSADQYREMYNYMKPPWW